MTVSEEKLAGVDQALAELGKSDEEVSAVRRRLLRAEPIDLVLVDEELSVLSEGVEVDVAAAKLRGAQTHVRQASDGDWENENTEVEIIDDSDFVLLVDERDLEELEKVGEDDALKTSPPALPQPGEEDEGFFKKLFGTRRGSNRP
ncbi:MAG: hypothetical protein WCE62_12590 [Polyangiales bacterium]